jgi:pentatricopeptide repeat protein
MHPGISCPSPNPIYLVVVLNCWIASCAQRKQVQEKAARFRKRMLQQRSVARWKQTTKIAREAK